MRTALVLLSSPASFCALLVRSIKSALSTRFVMHGNVRLRLERPLLAIPDDVLAVLQVSLSGRSSQDARSHDLV